MHTLGSEGVGGMEEKARLVGIEHDHRITKETDSRFLFELQRAILLSLKEGGALNEAQYRYAEEKLKAQLRNYERRFQEKQERRESSC